jgi:catechol 2,3-dioxygenase-like lactoylglutathione lyase family enzyme
MDGAMSFSVDRIDHVVVNSSDVDLTADWYVRVLGMARETFGDGRVALRFGDQKLNVRPTGAPNWVTAAVDAPGTLDLCFIANVAADAIGAHLRACGVEITEGPVAKTGALGPMTSHYCRDPDGNLIEVATYVRAD